jgi:hypothetical protein
VTTVYDIEAELRLRDLMSHALLGIGSHFTRLERNIKAAQLNINELSGAFKALGVVVAGGAIFKGLEVLTKHGLRLEHFKTQLEAAGYTTTQVTKAMNAAWKETGNNLNTVVADNVKNIHHLANITGNFDEAIKLLPMFNRAENAINSLKDEHVKGIAFASERQTYDFARTMEELGVMTQRPGETHEQSEGRITSTFNAMMKGIVAMRGLVDPSMLYAAVQNAGGTQLQWSQDFIGHELFPLLQTMGPAAANVGYMLTATLAQGRTTRATAEALKKYGFVNDSDIERYVGSRAALKPGSVVGTDLLKQNWVKWFSDVYLPQLAKAGVNIHDQNAVDAVTDEIFRNKSVARGARYATNPGTMAQLRKERLNIDRVPDDAIGILQRRDPSSVIGRFSTSWDNLMSALGDPLVPTAVSVLEKLTAAFATLKNYAVAHPGQIAEIGKALGVLTAALTALGVALTGTMLVAAFGLIGPGGVVVVGLATLAAAIVAFWDKIKWTWKDSPEHMDKKGAMHARKESLLSAYGDFFNRAYYEIGDELGHLWEKIKTARVTPEMFNGFVAGIGPAFESAMSAAWAKANSAIWDLGNKLGQAIHDAIASAASAIGGFFFGGSTGRAPAGGGVGARGTGRAPMGGPSLLHNQSYVPEGGGRPVIVHTALHMDGRIVADQVTYHQARASRFVGSAATFDGMMHPTPVDQSYT